MTHEKSQCTIISLISLLVILVAVLVWQNANQAATALLEAKTPKTAVALPETEITNVAVVPPETKTTYLGGTIPSHWSELDRGDVNVKDGELPNFQTNSTFAIGKKVKLGDSSELISFYFLTEANKENLFANAKEAYGNGVQTEEKILDGIPLTVTKYVTGGKDGGGVDYLMPIPAMYKLHESHPDYLLIRKESTGSAEFEMVFAKYIDSIDFAQLQEMSWNNYPR